MRRLITTSLAVLILMAVAVSTQAGVLFEDNFDSYNGPYPNESLFDVAPTAWRPDGLTSGVPEFLVGWWYGGKVFYQNSSWGEDVMHMAIANMGGTESDYIVNAEAWEEPGKNVRWCIGGRETAGNYARLKATIGNDGSVYATLLDSTGAATNDNYVAGWDKTKAIEMELTLIGGQLTGVITHDGYSTTIGMTTTVTGAGDAGFGGVYKWGYAGGRFDNFMVETPEPATICLLSLGFLVGLRKRK